MRNKIFANITNHPIDGWSTKQLAAAQELGEVVEVGFPVIPTDPNFDYTEVLDEYVTKMEDLGVTTALVQGEMVFVYRLVTELKQRGITCVAAMSERKVVEELLEDGTTRKTVDFDFQGFRYY